MALFDRTLHNQAEVGAYLGVRLVPRCPACHGPSLDRPECPNCGAAQPAPQPTRLIQGRLTDGTLKWFHLARLGLVLAAALRRLADRVEGR